MEANEIKRDKGKPQKNSGRGKIQKGDAKIGPFCYDIKEYPKGYTVTTDSWAKVSSDAWHSGRAVPALKIVLGTGDSKVRLWVIDDAMFHEMRGAWEEKYGEEIGS